MSRRPPENPKGHSPRPSAVALHYDGRGAPRVTAKGQGLVAENILRLAREHGVPLHEDAALAAVLSRLELNEEIPPALYRAIAEVIAFAYRIRGKTPLRPDRD